MEKNASCRKTLDFFSEKVYHINAKDKSNTERTVYRILKVKLETVSDVEETEVIIRCRELDEETERLLSTIRLFANTIIGKKTIKPSS